MSETVSPRALEVRGSSGAVFTVPFFSEHMIVKEGGDREAAQGKFMQDHADLGVFPRVINVTEKSYVMDRLTEVPYHLLNPIAFVEEATATFAHIWSEAPIVAFDFTAHLRKVYELCIRMRVDTGLFQNVRDEIDFNALPVSLTHGDATLENIMLGADGKLRLIDVIPASPAIPDMRSVDVGKMLQSVYGFEKIRYGEPLMADLSEIDAADMIFSHMDMDFNEIMASEYWAMVHFLRAMPYMKTDEERRKIRHEIERLYMAFGL